MTGMHWMNTQRPVSTRWTSRSIPEAPVSHKQSAAACYLWVCFSQTLVITGDVRWLSYQGIGTVTLKQPTNLRAYPFDTQSIPVTVWHKPDWVLYPNRCENADGSSYASTFDRMTVQKDSLEGWECW